jgi:hypothetical protein
MQDVTERLCSTHKVESLSLVGGLDGHIHQDKVPVETKPSATVQPASICHPQPQRHLMVNFKECAHPGFLYAD